MKFQTLWICVAAVLLGATAAHAQPIGGMNATKRLQIAEEKLKIGDLYNALDWFEKAYEDDTKNANVIGKIALLNYRLRDFKKAEQWFARLLTAEVFKPALFDDARFWYGRCLKMNGKYENAATEFQKFISEYNGTNAGLKKLAANEILGAQMAEEMKPEPQVRVENAGGRINSSFSEFSPYPVTNDEVYYGSIRSDSVIVLDDKKNDFYAQIYSAKREEKGFSEAKPLGKNINQTGFHTGNMTLTTDKNTMYFTRCQLNNNVLAHCDIFSSKRAADDWAEAVKLTGVNSESSTAKQPAVGTMNGKSGLYFSSDRLGGMGGWDIYFSEMMPDGTFSTPINLGEKVNTVGNEETPFFKNNTLYFASDGLPTLGGYDIFSSRITGSTAETARNLGKGVNSNVDDMYFTIADNDYQGYVVSNRKGTNSLKSETCCDDIWTVELPFTNNLMVTAIDRDSKTPLKNVTARLIEIGSTGRQSKTNPVSNEFTFSQLPVERRYRIVGTAEGYYADSTEITTVGIKKPTDLAGLLKLVKIPPPPPPPPVKPPVDIEPIIALHNIYWDFDKAVVRPDAQRTLDTIINVLKGHSGWVVEVASHTDALGTNQYNDQLSDRRTKSAIDWMAKYGVTTSQLVPAHFGEGQPADANTKENGRDNPEGRQRNRRTEFHILNRSGNNSTISAPSSSTTAPVKTGMQSVEIKKKDEVAKIKWLNGNTHDFGKMKKGAIAEYTFEFVNDGKVPLKIDFATGGCDCTKVVDYSKKEVPAGGKGFIKITFDTKEKDLGAAKGDANMIANTDPIVTEVKVTATVE
jgi:peptidoglycan-associated lipoprotein